MTLVDKKNKVTAVPPTPPLVSGSHLQEIEAATKAGTAVSVDRQKDFPDTDFLDSFVSPQVTRSKYPSLQDRHLFYASITPDQAHKVV